MGKGMDREEPVDIQRDFDRVYVMYFARMARFAEAYVDSAAEAENIVQDVFVSLLDRKDHVTLRKSLDSYMFSLVRNRCVDYLRHKEVEKSRASELAMKLEAIEFQEEILWGDDGLPALRKAVGKLPGRCREIFLKKHVEGLKYREIAEELGISVNTVENQMAIATRRLREELGGLI